MKQRIGEKVHNLLMMLRGENVNEVLKALNKTQWLKKEELENYQLKKLKFITQYAYNNTDYYKNLFNNNNIHPKDIKSLNDIRFIPLLTKKIIKETPRHKLISQQKLNYSVRETAGTSGIPVKVLIDRGAESYSLAARYRCQQWHNISIGDKQARFWGRPLSKKLFVKELCKNKLLNRISISNISDDKRETGRIVKAVSVFQPKYFYGYSSMIYNFAKKWQNYGCSCNALKLNAIICTAEELKQFQKKYIKNIFDCIVIREYGCSELDIIAFECECESLHIISENVLVEVVKNNTSDKYGKIVVTDLNNRIMPLIRYEVGDIITLSKSKCKCGRELPIIDTVQGRDQNQYIVLRSGEKIHSVIFAYFIEDLINKGLDIFQFQIEQKDYDTILLKIVSENNKLFKNKQLEKIIQNQFEPVLKNRVKIIVQNVYEIEDNKVSGKFSYFSSLVK